MLPSGKDGQGNPYPDWRRSANCRRRRDTVPLIRRRCLTACRAIPGAVSSTNATSFSRTSLVGDPLAPGRGRIVGLPCMNFPLDGSAAERVLESQILHYGQRIGVVPCSARNSLEVRQDDGSRCHGRSENLNHEAWSIFQYACRPTFPLRVTCFADLPFPFHLVSAVCFSLFRFASRIGTVPHLELHQNGHPRAELSPSRTTQLPSLQAIVSAHNFPTVPADDTQSPPATLLKVSRISLEAERTVLGALLLGSGGDHQGDRILLTRGFLRSHVKGPVYQAIYAAYQAASADRLRDGSSKLADNKKIQESAAAPSSPSSRPRFPRHPTSTSTDRS